MALKQLLIRDFRNIESADLDLSTGFNFLIGANASGKTSLLEAIYMLGHGRAFRSSQSLKIIRHQQEKFVLHGKIEGVNRIHSVGLTKNRYGASNARIDGDDNRKLAELAQLLPIQLITPEGFTLLNGGPRYRRAFLDWGCFHYDPQFFSIWNNLKRLLKQRNAALKQTYKYSAIYPWDKELISLTKRISAIRAAYVGTISCDLMQTCAKFLPEYSFNFSFSPGWNEENDYSEILVKQFERDKTLTYTSVGPHKADLRIRCSGYRVEDVLSRGQLKLLMCALKLAQGEHLTQYRGQRCIYLIDDFASELDLQRRQLLAQRLKATKAQVFVSAIATEQVDEMRQDEKFKVFFIEKGKIELQQAGLNG